ncbi:MAG: homoserine O-acetyltransferase MetX [Candidatus Bipolaricaulota bacterium]
MNESSVGKIESKTFRYRQPLELVSGTTFGPLNIAYETYGQLNDKKNNAILICHALSGDAHAAGWHGGEEKPGWWDQMIGPGKAFDTDKYFVICSNVLGGCSGTTGPSSINPETGEPYGLTFPVVTIEDMVNAQKKLIDDLGLGQLLAVAGGSMGGMQAIQWTISYPEFVKFCIPIATTAVSSPQQIALNEVRRKAIMFDPKWSQGDYYGKKLPEDGLRLARMIGHITYLSETSMREKFGRQLEDKGGYSFEFDIDFQVESYLHYKGGSFVERFDPNSYLYITKAIDYFDLTKGGEKSLIEALRGVQAKFLVVAISSDWLYPSYQSKRLVRALESVDVDVTYAEITSTHGHDAFLLESGQLKHMVSNFLSRITARDVMRSEVPVIEAHTSIDEASRVILDNDLTHVPVSDSEGKITGIFTAWDVARAVAEGVDSLSEVVTTDVITASPDESIEEITAKIRKFNISGLPVLDERGHLLGLVTSDSITQLIQGDQPIPGSGNRISELK